jgi:hypothetical protein
VLGSNAFHCFCRSGFGSSYLIPKTKLSEPIGLGFAQVLDTGRHRFSMVGKLGKVPVNKRAKTEGSQDKLQKDMLLTGLCSVGA